MTVAVPSTPPTRTLVERLRRYNYAPLVALVILVTISAFLSPYFFTWGNLHNIVRQASYFGIVALGMTFVIIGGGIDLSVGSMVAFVGVVTVAVVERLSGGASPPSAVVAAFGAALLLGAVLGLANGATVTLGRIAPFIVTLGTLSIWRSLALYFADAGEKRSTNELFGAIGQNRVLWVAVPIWTFLVLAILFHVLLHDTRFGRHVCAVGSNERVAQFSAISVGRIRTVTYVLAGATVGISAFLWTARTTSVNSTAFAGVELDAIAAVIIGGTAITGGRGSVWGTVVGAIMLQLINNMLNLMSVSPYLQGTVKGLVIIVAALIQRRL